MAIGAREAVENESTQVLVNPVVLGQERIHILRGAGQSFDVDTARIWHQDRGARQSDGEEKDAYENDAAEGDERLPANVTSH